MLGKKHKILVADDDIAFLKIADEKLSQRGFHVVISSLDGAIGVLKQEAFESIILDYNKAQSSGIEIFNVIESLDIKPVIQYFGQPFHSEVYQELYGSVSKSI
jgi:ActR/RegA family two-component response regulator